MKKLMILMAAVALMAIVGNAKAPDNKELTLAKTVYQNELDKVTAEHLKNLEAIKVNLGKEGRIDDAFVVKAEIDAMKKAEIDKIKKSAEVELDVPGVSRDDDNQMANTTWRVLYSNKTVHVVDFKEDGTWSFIYSDGRTFNGSYHKEKVKGKDCLILECENDAGQSERWTKTGGTWKTSSLANDAQTGTAKQEIGGEPKAPKK